MPAQEPFPLYLRSNILNKALNELDDVIVKLEETCEHHRLSAEYWERKYNNLKAEKRMSGTILGSELNEFVAQIPSSEDVSEEMSQSLPF